MRGFFFFDRKLPEYWLPPTRKPLLKPTNQLSNQSGDGASSWTRYWQSGFQDTCFFADQTFAVDQFWHDLFTKLDHSSRIVDLATGNGSVALKAAKFAREQKQDFEISGVDYASKGGEHLFSVKRPVLEFREKILRFACERS